MWAQHQGTRSEVATVTPSQPHDVDSVIRLTGALDVSVDEDEDLENDETSVLMQSQARSRGTQQVPPTTPASVKKAGRSQVKRASVCHCATVIMCKELWSETLQRRRHDLASSQLGVGKMDNL